jgi:hypothetical protein
MKSKASCQVYEDAVIILLKKGGSKCCKQDVHMKSPNFIKYERYISSGSNDPYLVRQSVQAWFWGLVIVIPFTVVPDPFNDCNLNCT